MQVSYRRKLICVVADNTDLFIVLFFVVQRFENTVFFRQGKSSDTDGTTYYNINSVSDYVGAEICEILPFFHALTGSDYTNPFFKRTKVQSFKRMVAAPSSMYEVRKHPSFDKVYTSNNIQHTNGEGAW